MGKVPYWGIGFVGLSADLKRHAEIFADDAKHFDREHDVALWACHSDAPDQVRSRVAQIGGMPEWQ